MGLFAFGFFASLLLRFCPLAIGSSLMPTAVENVPANSSPAPVLADRQRNAILTWTADMARKPPAPRSRLCALAMIRESDDHVAVALAGGVERSTTAAQVKPTGRRASRDTTQASLTPRHPPRFLRLRDHVLERRRAGSEPNGSVSNRLEGGGRDPRCGAARRCEERSHTTSRTCCRASSGEMLVPSRRASQ